MAMEDEMDGAGGGGGAAAVNLVEEDAERQELFLTSVELRLRHDVLFDPLAGLLAPPVPAPTRRRTRRERPPSRTRRTRIERDQDDPGSR